MSSVLGIDPGLRRTGLAWRIDDKSPVVTYVEPTSRSIRDKAREIYDVLPFDWCFDMLIVEVPQVYREVKQKGDPNDLINLALLAGNLEALISAREVIEVRPGTWKGQIPKHTHHARLRGRTGFTGIVPHDALDALGIMLYGEDMKAAQVAARELRSKR